MYPEAIQRLIRLLTALPGVGPRQAARMAFFVVREDPQYAASLAASLDEVKAKVVLCKECFRSMGASPSGLCTFCDGPKRNSATICVVEKEMDIQNLEKAGAYDGLYHVLGGTVAVLDPESPKRLKLKELHQRVGRKIAEGPLEVILALSPTPEGDTTALYAERMLDEYAKLPQFTLTRLGRGMSAGAEVEYADEVTLQNALKNRR